MESNVQRLLTKLTFIAALLVGVSAGAWAAGNADAGKDLVAACGACHGADGATGLDPTYPNLAGQNEKYLYDQLKMIQDKTRDIALMAGQLDASSDQNLADMAAYYASLPGKVSQASGDDDAIAQAEQIYRAGIARKGVAACAACHGPSGAGNAQAGFPSLNPRPTPRLS